MKTSHPWPGRRRPPCGHSCGRTPPRGSASWRPWTPALLPLSARGGALAQPLPAGSGCYFPWQPFSTDPSDQRVIIMRSFVTRLAAGIGWARRVRRPGWTELGSGTAGSGPGRGRSGRNAGMTTAGPRRRCRCQRDRPGFPHRIAGSVALIDGTTVTRVAEVPVFRPGDSSRRCRPVRALTCLTTPGPGGAGGRRLAHAPARRSS